MREFNDRGFEPAWLKTALEVTLKGFPSFLQSAFRHKYGRFICPVCVCSFRQASFEMIVAQGGIIGWTTSSDALKSALLEPEIKEVSYFN